ncbi:hypothetical protein HW555_011064, partial [Spodoptera exigua]
LPETGPSVRAQKSWYSIGDMLRANCTSPPADPPANLTWLLNGQEVIGLVHVILNVVVTDILSQVKGLDIPLHDTSYARRKPVITDTSLEDANRIIFSPWDAISGYEEPVTDNVIDIPGNIDGVVGIPHADSNRKNKEESTTRLAPRLEQIANKLNISIEEEKSNKSSSFSQLVIRVQSVHFRKAFGVKRTGERDVCGTRAVGVVEQWRAHPRRGAATDCTCYGQPRLKFRYITIMVKLT